MLLHMRHDTPAGGVGSIGVTFAPKDGPPMTVMTVHRQEWEHRGRPVEILVNLDWMEYDAENMAQKDVKL